MPGLAKTYNLDPNGDITNNWTEFGGYSTAWESLADDTEISTGVEASIAVRDFEVEFEDINFNSLNIHTVTSIQAVMQANSTDRGTTSVLLCSYRDSSSNIINSYSENITVNPTGMNTQYTWTERTTVDGSAGWDSDDINGLRLHVELKTAPSAGSCKVFKLRVWINYTEPPVPTYTSDATKIHTLKNGILTLKGGLVDLKNK